MFEKIKAISAQLGFCDFGVCAHDESIKNKNTYLNADDYAKSVLMFVYPYEKVKAPSPRLASYAYLTDYHIMLKKKLEVVCELLKNIYPNERFEIFTDISPINEKQACINCGLGQCGKNTLITTKSGGSFVLICEIISSTEIKDSKYSGEDICGSCDVCVKACPNGALDNGFDRGKCISYITQKNGELSENEKQLIKQTGYIWGCDICALACPKNKAVNEKNAQFEIDMEEIKSLSNNEYKEKYKDRAFMYKGKNLMVRNLEAYFDK